MNKFIFRHINLFITLIACLIALSSHRASALPLSTYAENSRLSSGTWIKISVPSSGVYLVTNLQLKQMGFSDPSKVKVYGYGAMRLPDRLDSSYIDDLPVVQSLTTSRGIIFYGLGPLTWNGNTPVSNPFTTVGYYFLSDADTGVETPEISLSGAASTEEGYFYFTEHLLHEEELTSPGETGHMLVGEDFRYTSSQSFPFTLPGMSSAEETVSIRCSFVAASTSESTIALSANGETLHATSTDRFNAVNDGDIHYRENITDKTAVTGNKLTVGIKFSSSGTVKTANLNYIAVAYARELSLSGLGSLSFTAELGASKTSTLSGATEQTVIWDVTSPRAITKINASAVNGSISWVSSWNTTRNYVAFDPEASLPAPTIVGRLANQNIHGAEVPDMVIISPKDWIAQAQRLADFHHSTDGLQVLVVDQEDVFNEFSSGAADANAFRKMLKMFYDRSETSERKLQYALFFGRGTFDTRRLTSGIKNIGYPTMPLWQTDTGASDTDSFSTDDIFAFLRDNSGTNLSSDYYCIAVGRMPVTSVSDARNAVDKIEEYYSSMPKNEWRNRVMLIADDKDSAIHMNQTETLHSNMLNSSGGGDMIYRKVYSDAYTLEGNLYPAAHDDIFRYLGDGVAWMTYIGHASTLAWSGEGLLTYNDINNMYLKAYPIVYAATCSFLRWDAKDYSGAEIMWKLASGGCIAAISALRPVYITDNGNLSASIGRWAFNRNSEGNRLTIGQIYQNAKNDFRVGDKWSADANKLRYVLMGDPAMRPVVPSNRVVIDEINGVKLGGDDQAIMMGFQQATMSGRVVSGDGELMDDFNGVLATTIYDAERSITTHGYKTPGKEDGKSITFEQTGERLYAGNDSVKNGRFNISISMPSEISNNFREAAAAMYAYTSDVPQVDAAGANREFYVFGYDDEAEPDTEAPTIKAFYLNHPSFKSGDAVNTSPTVIAEISDNRGINMSAAGIGHEMTLLMDDKTNYNDVNQYYTPSFDGTVSGTIVYQFEDLTEGNHSLRLRVWDTAGNSSVATIDFFAKAGVQPKIYDVYTDTNPASVEANFYLSHDRPDAMISVTFAVYNMLGQPVWTSTSSGRSDMYLSYPVTWNLTDNAGRRVPRGIYLYRASITADGETSETVTHRIAVTAP